MEKQKLTGAEVRKVWRAFFERHGHLYVPSRSLVPDGDSSLLWINSGVATLKDYFTGRSKPPAPRLVNCQRAIRTNDIENVGVTSRHHTLFEMLGNFSIGDYFREEAIALGYELIFNEFKFDPAKIYVTYFVEDKVTKDTWLKLGLHPDHIITGSRKTNFWDIGHGPCGPSTEIFYDRGQEYDKQGIGLKLLIDDIENDRYIEIWNIVLSQFNNDGSGNYTELKQKNIDTGAGLERITAVLQDAHTNFDTDLFLPIINPLAKSLNLNYITKSLDPAQKRINRALRTIADHVRAVSVAIADGVMPASTQRGYIVRRLIRRANLSLRTLSASTNLMLADLVPFAASIMEEANINVEAVTNVIRTEESEFTQTISRGLTLLETKLANGAIDVNTAFQLHETYGLPLEITTELLELHGITLNQVELSALSAKHSAISRSLVNKGFDEQIAVVQQVTSTISNFVGYDELSVTSTVVACGTEEGKHYVLLDKTPFYATGGGQEHDKGTINNINVLTVFSDKFNNHWHVSAAPFSVGQKVIASVDANIRHAKMRTHSATHLLQGALRLHLGENIKQVGSFNNEEYLRFDFPFHRRLTDEEINVVEETVNRFITENHLQATKMMTFSDGQKQGVIGAEVAKFKSDALLRVVDFGVSQEFCGGTHVKSSIEIEQFKITSLENKGGGVYRINAITSAKQISALEAAQIADLQSQLQALENKIKAIEPSFKVPDSANNVPSLTSAINELRLYLKSLGTKSTNVILPEKLALTKYRGHEAHVDLHYPHANALKNYCLALSEKYPHVLVLVSAKTEAEWLVCVAAKAIDVQPIFNDLATNFGGKGGGHLHFAMGKFSKEIII